MKIDANTLKQFCATNPNRPYLHQPWTRDGWTYATNGHILVRVPALDDVSPSKEAPNTAKLFDGINVDQPMRPLPKYVLPDPVMEVCRKCDGLGNEHDCPDCTHPCENCDGKGEILSDVSVALGQTVFNGRYIRLLVALPEVQVPASLDKTDRLYFTFYGGDGLLMPLLGKRKAHVEEPAP